MNALKILIVGGACTGKTTLAQAIVKKYPMFQAPPESVRTLCVDYNYHIDNGNTPIQMSILALEASRASDNKNYILDSCLLGSRAYTDYYKRRGLSDIEGDAYRFYCDYTTSLMKQFIDLIIFLRAGEFEVVGDGFRIIDEDYVKEVDSIIDDLIIANNLQDKVITCSGSVEERLEQCSVAIDRLLKERVMGNYDTSAPYIPCKGKVNSFDQLPENAIPGDVYIVGGEVPSVYMRMHSNSPAWALMNVHSKE